MVMLVSLQQAKMRLRIDQDIEDADLTLMIQGASAAVLNYLKETPDYIDSFGEPAVDSNGDPVDVPAEVMNAVLMLTGILSRDRDGQESEKWELGMLPRAVVSLIYTLRDPALK